MDGRGLGSAATLGTLRVEIYRRSGRQLPARLSGPRIRSKGAQTSQAESWVRCRVPGPVDCLGVRARSLRLHPQLPIPWRIIPFTRCANMLQTSLNLRETLNAWLLPGKAQVELWPRPLRRSAV